MSQVSADSGTACGRAWWPALRPLLVLGGFVALWWALMTGVAHADGQGERRATLTDSLGTSVKADKAPVREAVRRVHHDVKASTSTVTAPVRQHVQPVVRTTTAVVSETPVAPAVEQITQTVRSTVSETAAKTRSLLTKTAVKPPAHTVRDSVRTTVEKPESSTGQGDSASQRLPRANSVTLLPAAVEGSGLQSEPQAEPDRASTSMDVDSPVDGPQELPSAPDPCTSPSGSGSASVTPVGIFESSLLAMPAVSDDHRSWRLARLPGGAAYEPGSSPD